MAEYFRSLESVNDDVPAKVQFDLHESLSVSRDPQLMHV